MVMGKLYTITEVLQLAEQERFKLEMYKAVFQDTALWHINLLKETERNMKKSIWNTLPDNTNIFTEAYFLRKVNALIKAFKSTKILEKGRAAMNCEIRYIQKRIEANEEFKNRLKEIEELFDEDENVYICLYRELPQIDNLTKLSLNDNFLGHFKKNTDFDATVVYVSLK